MSGATDNPIIGCFLIVVILLVVFIAFCGPPLTQQQRTQETVVDSQQSRSVGAVHEVNTINLNMRSGPGRGYPIVGTFPKRSKLVLYGETATIDGEPWTQASTPDGQTKGWVNRIYLSP